jgi:hypothetical protein
MLKYDWSDSMDKIPQPISIQYAKNDMLLVKKKVFALPVAMWLTLMMVPPLSAEEAGTSDPLSRPSLGGPDAVENQMKSDRIESDVLIESSLFKPYFAWKDGISNFHLTLWQVDEREEAGVEDGWGVSCHLHIMSAISGCRLSGPATRKLVPARL